MRVTGIATQVDNLGHIVIPKEIRRKLKIKEGDVLEIYVSANGEAIIIKNPL